MACGAAPRRNAADDVFGRDNRVILREPLLRSVKSLLVWMRAKPSIRGVVARNPSLVVFWGGRAGGWC